MKADLIITGAGPAGLFAAIQAAENNEMQLKKRKKHHHSACYGMPDLSLAKLVPSTLPICKSEKGGSLA